MPIDMLFFFERSGIDPNLHTRKWFSDAVSSRFPRQAQREQRRSFGEAITDGDLPAQRFELRRQLRLKRRTAGSEQPKVFAKTFVQRAKQQLAGSQVELSRKTTCCQKDTEQSARDPAGRLHLRFDTGIKR